MKFRCFAFLMFVTLCFGMLACGRALKPNADGGSSGIDAGSEQTGGVGGAEDMDAADDVDLGEPPVGGQDGGVADAGQPPNGVMRRLVVVSFYYGFLESIFKMRFDGTAGADGETWERSLIGDDVAWSPVLAPFADLAPHVTIVEGLSLQTAIADPHFDAWSQPATILTGNLGSQQLGEVKRPSLDWLVGAANKPPGGVTMVVAGTNDQVSFDGSGARLMNRNTSQVWGDLFTGHETSCAPGPRPMALGQTPPFAAWWKQMTAVVVDAFRCDRTRVFTLLPSGPIAPEFEFVGSVHQDLMDSWTLTEQDTEQGRRIRDLITLWTLSWTKSVADFARALDGVAEGQGTMLDHTLILLVGKEGHPGHQPYPWQMVMVGGRGLGLKTGRYVHVAQDHHLLPFNNPIQVGAAHNHALVSIANLFGLPINSVGMTQLDLRGANGPLQVDLTGPLRAFYAEP